MQYEYSNAPSGSSSFLDAALEDVSPEDVPPAPWQLHGSAVAMLCRVPRTPENQSLLPWGVLALVHYQSSPVGSYNEMAVAVLTRRGPSIVQMPVSLKASMMGGRRNWGFPKTLAPLNWQQHGRHILFTAGTKQYRARAFGPSFSLRLDAVSTQMLHGESMRVPVEITGRVRLAWCGRRLAVLLEDFAMMVHPPLNQNGGRL
jgi:hypothetical protein